MKIPESFFARDTRQVALEILGKYLVRRLDDEIIPARVTSVEAYKGMGKRDKPGILYPPGKIYLYPLRGSYNFNISTEGEGIPACVMIREVEIGGERYGQLKLIRILKIDKSFEGKSIEGEELWVDDGIVSDETPYQNRIGIYSIKW